MRRFVLAALALAFILPLSAQAQQWNAEQQEVWAALEACWDAQETEGFMACIHDDYVAWWPNQGVPMNRADARPLLGRNLEVSDVVWRYRKPLNIDVRGNVAIVIYVANYVTRNKTTGEESATTTNWTEVFERDGNKWLLLTDHGTEVGGN